jgi:hypothetical protein
VVQYEVATRPLELGALPPNPLQGLLQKGDGFSVSPLFRPLSRRSGCVAAEPYPPLRYSQSGPQ